MNWQSFPNYKQREEEIFNVHSFSRCGGKISVHFRIAITSTEASVYVYTE